MKFELSEYRQGVTEEELIEDVKKCGSFKDKLRIILVTILPLIIFSCQPLNMEVPTETCSSSYKINKNHPKAEKLQEKLEEIVALDIPGAVIAIKDGSGIWAAAAGYAKTEKSVPMELCHLQFGQSVAKTYMATAILLLYQEGKIDLDATIDSTYWKYPTSNSPNAIEPYIRYSRIYQSTRFYRFLPAESIASVRADGVFALHTQ